MASPAATNGANLKFANARQSSKDMISSFISELQGEEVAVRLNSGSIFQGYCESIDQFMHINLGNCRQIEDGKEVKYWGDAFIRGNNVSYIALRGE
ncbi:putative U6 snRNA-associated Sm-like protein LSm6 [Amniculicola lignicola CBS 123094]|uniref:U6 snRNA-associated Sm-like protein LSm6 n=1 Tax=Amniculicola lignicola CBS 123094 TaxID=1392246 RepID=A0A6A5X0N7_9PLEO|nr:putative U6 snRNA-associated Sm-like protein LSm6 [Amniculicola lignicola CBS 123094]